VIEISNPFIANWKEKIQPAYLLVRECMNKCKIRKKGKGALKKENLLGVGGDN
jgi:hypothetical protein